MTKSTPAPHAPDTSHPPDHVVTLADGRVLAVDETGRPDGPVVLFLHAAPGSRRFDPDPAATAAAGVRLVTVDRPGYGGSSPVAEATVPTMAALADDLAAVLDALGIAEVGVIGWSTGGVAALALAARHPERVWAAALVGTPAPDTEVAWIPDEYRQQLRALEPVPETAVATLSQPLSALANADEDGQLATVAAGPADTAALADPVLRARVAAMVAEAFRPGPAGLAIDITASGVVPWGFDPAAVGAVTSLFYGDADVVVPPAHGEYWATVIPATDLHVVPGAGHLVVASAWGDALAAVR